MYLNSYILKSYSNLQAQLEREMTELGVDVPGEGSHYLRNKSRSVSRPPVKRARDASVGTARSKSRPARDQSGLRDNVMVKKVCCLSYPLIIFFLFL